MNLDIVIEGENTFEVGPRSKLAISSHSDGNKAEDRVLYRCTNEKFGEEKGQLWSAFSSESFFYNHSIPHRKSMPCISIGVDPKVSEPLKRGSLYQSSKEVQRLQKVRDRRKVETDLSNSYFLSLEVIDSLPWNASKKYFCFPQPTNETTVSLNLEPKFSSPINVQSFQRVNTEFLDLPFCDLSEARSKISLSCSEAAPAGKSSAENHLGKRLPTDKISRIIGKEAPDLLEKVQVKETSSGTDQLSRDGVHSMSFSEMVETSNTSYISENGILKSSSKTNLSTLKKLLDPIMKSKSLRLEAEISRKAVGTPSLSRYKFFPKSVSNGFASENLKTKNEESNRSDQENKKFTSLVHLHAVLKWDPNHDAPMFEFSVKDPEDVLFAKTWKSENAFSWAYTFYSSKKRNKSRSLGTKDKNDQPPMIAQMQVSCYLCSELSETGSFDNSAVTEFTLYDITIARQNAVDRNHLPLKSNQTAVFPVTDNLTARSSSELNNFSENECYHFPVRHNSSDFDSERSTSFPWKRSELKPNLEIAAIVIQIPFSKKGNLKILQGGENYNSGNQGLSTSATDQAITTIDNHKCLTEMKVVTPTGRHGASNSEEFAPSSLLDRWRFGGGCDCGGWDMGCPIVVFDTLYITNPALIFGTRQPIVLFSKGKREKLPALTITPNGKGQYAVDFHAQLSALQAFSICIAVLHGCEASSALYQDKNRHKLYSDSLKLLLEDEVKHIIEAVTGEEKRISKRRVEQAPSSFFLDTPFSPMGRV